MNGDRTAARTILFVSNSPAFYGAERSLLEIVDVLSASWKPRFVVPAPGH